MVFVHLEHFFLSVNNFNVEFRGVVTFTRYDIRCVFFYFVCINYCMCMYVAPAAYDKILSLQTSLPSVDQITGCRRQKRFLRWGKFFPLDTADQSTRCVDLCPCIPISINTFFFLYTPAPVSCHGVAPRDIPTTGSSTDETRSTDGGFNHNYLC